MARSTNLEWISFGWRQNHFADLWFITALPRRVRRYRARKPGGGRAALAATAGTLFAVASSQRFIVAGDTSSCSTAAAVT